jgi:hypothetical protein
MAVPTILFGHHGGCLEVLVLGRVSPAAEDAWDRDALRAHVSLEADGLACDFPLQTYSHELLYLRRLLAALHARVGQAINEQFRFLEAELALVFVLSPRGQLTVQVAGQPGPESHGVGASAAPVRFEIAVDQSYLPEWIRTLDAVLEQYPLQVSWEPTLPSVGD